MEISLRLFQTQMIGCSYITGLTQRRTTIHTQVPTYELFTVDDPLFMSYEVTVLTPPHTLPPKISLLILSNRFVLYGGHSGCGAYRLHLRAPCTRSPHEPRITQGSQMQ